MQKFQGKVALVTGGNSGIGKATALAFARAGAKVLIAARREREGNETVEAVAGAGGEAMFVATDVSRAGDVERMVARAVERFGRLDYAFNNAARTDENLALTADLSEEDFDKTVAINLKGVWLGMKYQIRQMLSQSPPGGVIVNTSSGNGLGGCPMAAFYSATKAGVIALTKSAALEYSRQGIRINTLVAGAFRTPMLEYGMEKMSGGNPELRQAAENRWQDMIPAGRIADPAEAAAAVLWLCSDDSSYVVGHSLIVDGGLTAFWR